MTSRRQLHPQEHQGEEATLRTDRCCRTQSSQQQLLELEKLQKLLQRLLQEMNRLAGACCLAAVTERRSGTSRKRSLCWN